MRKVYLLGNYYVLSKTYLKNNLKFSVVLVKVS